MDQQVKSLTPYLDKTWDIRGGIPGISGIQHITTDSKGFRVTKNIEYSKKNAFRIFIIGASTAEQIFLDDHNTWTYLLEKTLGEKYYNVNIEVINTGVSGTRVKHNYYTLLEIMKFRPDIVIFHLGMNDAYYHIITYFDPLFSFSFERSFLGRQIKHLFYSLTEEKKNREEKSRPEIIYGEEYARKRNSLARAERKKFRPESVSKGFAKYLMKIIEMCKENGITCVFMTQRCGYQEEASEEYKKGFWMTPPETGYTLDFESMVYISKLYNNYIIDLAQNKGIYVVDCEKKVLPSYEFMYDDCHLNINGAKRVSDVLSQFLAPVLENLQPFREKLGADIIRHNR